MNLSLMENVYFKYYCIILLIYEFRSKKIIVLLLKSLHTRQWSFRQNLYLAWRTSQKPFQEQTTSVTSSPANGGQTKVFLE